MLDVDAYTIIARYFPRLVGLIYFFAFFPFLFQITGLVGEKGIMPASIFLKWIKQRFKKRAYYIAPTLFWINASDKALVFVVAVGVVFSILLIAGFLPPVMLFCLYVLYLSIISVGQDFLSFGWEVFLQEIALNTFLLSLSDAPNVLVWISLNLLLLRFHFEGGIVKFLSRDRNWKNFTAVGYHYESQPIPNALSWYVHKLPMWMHKVSCCFMFFIELIVPFLILTTQELRLAAFFCFVFLQMCIWATGNFSYLNHMTVLFSTILLNNSFLQNMGFSEVALGRPPLFVDVFLYITGGALVLLQVMRLWDHMFGNPFFHKILYSLSSFHIANRYGIFAIMTTTRYEVVVEASNDKTEWKEYYFYHKPTELNRRPRRVSPYQPRIDWQAWFLPFRRFYFEIWFQNFLIKLLEGESCVLKLLRHNPFPEAPPRYIRAMMYVYSFTSFAEKKKSGNWWKRKLVGPYSPVLSLDGL